MFYLLYFEHDKSTAVVHDDDVIYPPKSSLSKTKKTKERLIQKCDNIIVNLDNEEFSGTVVTISESEEYLDKLNVDEYGNLLDQKTNLNKNDISLAKKRHFANEKKMMQKVKKQVNSSMNQMLQRTITPIHLDPEEPCSKTTTKADQDVTDKKEAVVKSCLFCAGLQVTSEVVRAFEVVLSHLKVILNDKEKETASDASAEDFIKETHQKKDYQIPKPGYVRLSEGYLCFIDCVLMSTITKNCKDNPREMTRQLFKAIIDKETLAKSNAEGGGQNEAVDPDVKNAIKAYVLANVSQQKITDKSNWFNETINKMCASVAANLRKRKVDPKKPVQLANKRQKIFKTDESTTKIKSKFIENSSDEESTLTKKPSVAHSTRSKINEKPQEELKQKSRSDKKVDNTPVEADLNIIHENKENKDQNVMKKKKNTLKVSSPSIISRSRSSSLDYMTDETDVESISEHTITETDLPQIKLSSRQSQFITEKKAVVKATPCSKTYSLILRDTCEPPVDDSTNVDKSSLKDTCEPPVDDSTNVDKSSLKDTGEPPVDDSTNVDKSSSKETCIVTDPHPSQIVTTVKNELKSPINSQLPTNSSVTPNPLSQSSAQTHSINTNQYFSAQPTSHFSNFPPHNYQQYPNFAPAPYGQPYSNYDPYYYHHQPPQSSNFFHHQPTPRPSPSPSPYQPYHQPYQQPFQQPFQQPYQPAAGPYYHELQTPAENDSSYNPSEIQQAGHTAPN